MSKSSSGSGLLRIENLCLHFRTMRGNVQAVDGVSFGLDRGRTLVVVGESGCGKSSLAKAVLRLLPRNVSRYTGKIYLNGEELMALGDEKFRRDVRWAKISMVPQAAMNSLNPVVRVEDQVAEPLLVHKYVSTKAAAYDRVREAFKWVGVPLDFMSRYPFELSGGMRQRVALAMALVTDPDLVVMDEPTSALDLLTQANIMNVLKRIKKEIGITFILITHDIATSSELADDAAVMYAGQLVEFCDAGRFYLDPWHPYSKGLMSSVPTIWEKKDLGFIPGQPPSLLDPPKGCRFAERCPNRFDKCDQEPPLTEVEDGRWVKCWLYR
jgi:peptide/nickel transport system ATP-binding protein